MERKRSGVSGSLDTPERQAAYIGSAFEKGDTDAIRDAVGQVARLRGMPAIASATKLNRESLYRALGSSGNPEFTTVIKVMKALGLRLSVLPITAGARPRRARARAAR